MVMESISDQRLVCAQISESLLLGTVDRVELLKLAKTLSSVVHELAWQVKGQLQGRGDTPEMQQANRWVSSAQSALTWAESHSSFALTFELARCLELANTSAVKVLERLQLQREGAAA